MSEPHSAQSSHPEHSVLTREQRGQGHYVHRGNACPHFGSTSDRDLNKPADCVCARRAWVRLGARTEHSDDEPTVPVERIQAALRLLSPEHLTPQAVRVLQQICAEYE